jgi:hypothetical protein
MTATPPDRVRCSKCKVEFPDPMNHTGCCEEPGCSGIAERYYPDDRIGQMTGRQTPPGLTQQERADITAALEDVCDESRRLRQIVNKRKCTAEGK